jgi:hypothetical protein
LKIWRTLNLCGLACLIVVFGLEIHARFFSTTHQETHRDLLNASAIAVILSNSLWRYVRGKRGNVLNKAEVDGYVR